MKKISQAIYIEVMETLLHYKRELKAKYELSLGMLWSDTNMRLKHYYLDQVQWLLEDAYNFCDSLPTAYESISNFSLIQEVLEKTNLTEQKKEEFVKWYLRYHNKFYLDSLDSQFASFLDIGYKTRLANFSASHEEVVDLEKQFLQRKKEVLVVQQFNRKPILEQVNTIQTIYRGWGIDEKYLHCLLPNDRLPKQSANENKSSSVFSNLQVSKSSNVLNRNSSYALNSELKSYIVKDGLIRYFNKEEMQNLQRLLISYYGEVVGQSLYRLYSSQNEKFLEQKMCEIRLASFSKEEEEFYQSILGISDAEQPFLNPYYWKLICGHLKEIAEILLTMVAVCMEDDFKVYEEMLHQEMQAMQEIYPFLWKEGNLKRGKKF